MNKEHENISETKEDDERNDSDDDEHEMSYENLLETVIHVNHLIVERRKNNEEERAKIGNKHKEYGNNKENIILDFDDNKKEANDTENENETNLTDILKDDDGDQINHRSECKPCGNHLNLNEHQRSHKKKLEWKHRKRKSNNKYMAPLKKLKDDDDDKIRSDPKKPEEVKKETEKLMEAAKKHMEKSKELPNKETNTKTSE